MLTLESLRKLGAAIVVVACAVPAFAGDAFEDLAAADATPDALRKRVAEVAVRLTRGTQKVRGEHFIFCSADAQRRDTRAANLERVMDRGIKALADAGLKMSGTPPETVVVEVFVRGGFTGALEGKGGHAILIRSGPGARSAPGRGALPTLPVRSDGRPIDRDVVDAASKVRLELWRRAGNTTDSAETIYDVLAARLVGWSGFGEAAPAWVRLGVSGWLAAQMAEVPLPPPGHVCSVSGAGTIARVLDPKLTPVDAGAAHFARIVDALVARKADVAGGTWKIATADAVTDEAFTEAFGVPAVDIAKAVFPEGAGEASCVEGRLDCTVCTGTGQLEIACPDCAGSAAVGCTSCLGSDSCYARGCSDGTHYYDSGKKAKCGYCGGKGTTKCKPCRGSGSATCHSCRKGVSTRTCPACVAGKLPCPESGGDGDVAKTCGEVSGTPCPWCKVKDAKRYCDDCGGAGYKGCRKCFGTARDLCSECTGSGIQIMVYSDGTIASSTKCPACKGKGYTRCDDCKGGSKECTCAGKGVQALTSEGCPHCFGEGVVPDIAATIDHRRKTLAPPTKAESEKIGKALKDGVAFILKSQKSGAFALREFRSSPRSAAGSMDDPTLFSNAHSIWTLSTAGITREHKSVKGPFEVLRTQAAAMATNDAVMPMTQASSLALRALVGAGADAEDEVVEGLVKLLVKGQKKDGLWSKFLTDDEDGEAYHGLYAVESLWLASRRGVKVPKRVFDKAFRAGSKLFGSKGFAGDDYVTGTDVCSAVALVVIAKAGSLGKESGTFDYDSLPAVQKGLAWLDRYLDIRDQPVLSNGALVRNRGDSGYAAYLFAVQRLGMLLNIEVLGGERWFTVGARHLLDIQYSDGSWEETGRRRLNGPVRTTNMALLFLSRATPAVTESGSR